MKAVGVRELKNRLSDYLRLVRTGEGTLVTDRGEVVAELRQPSPRAALPYPALLDVVRQGGSGFRSQSAAASETSRTRRRR